MAGIKIETGLKTYDIEDENGNVRGQIGQIPQQGYMMKHYQLSIHVGCIMVII